MAAGLDGVNGGTEALEGMPLTLNGASREGATGTESQTSDAHGSGALVVTPLALNGAARGVANKKALKLQQVSPAVCDRALKAHGAAAARGGSEIAGVGLTDERQKGLELSLEAGDGESEGGDEARRVHETRHEAAGGDGGVEVIDTTVGMVWALRIMPLDPP